MGCTGANASFSVNTLVSLNASPATGYGAATFVGCNGVLPGTCSLTMSEPSSRSR